LYDALLDGLDDEPISRADDTLDLVDDPVDGLEVDDDLDPAVLEDDEEHDPELDLGAEDLLAGVEDDDSWSDDPVRMYLTQMGEIPLLTRLQEVSLAKQIEHTRAKFRHKVLECDYVMQTAVKVLRRVQDGELPFDRTVQVSVTVQLE
jgi:RNA polymerase primary sigma factor